MSGTHKRKRALIVLNCGLSVPSATVRALQYQPHFDRSPEWSAEFVSRKSERWTYWANRTHQPGVPGVVPLVHRPLARGAAAWERRQEDAIVRQAAQFDLVYLVKMPHLRLYRRLRELGGPRVVMDLNDGLWLPAFQAHEWRDLDALLTTADGVICENDHVAGYARRHNPRVTVVPDSPQVEVFDRWRGEVRRNPNQVVLGWIGGAENVGALYRVWEPLEALFARHPQLQLRVVGASPSHLPRFESVRCSCLPAYNQEQMVREALAFDIGLFPMFHNGDGLARGTLKAMIYMSAGAAVLAENYGENPSLVQDGVNGVLAAASDEWLQKLDWLVTHPQERAAIARRGLETIRSRFTAEHVFQQLTAAFDWMMAGGPEVAPAPSQPAIASAAASSVS